MYNGAWASVVDEAGLVWAIIHARGSGMYNSGWPSISALSFADFTAGRTIKGVTYSEDGNRLPTAEVSICKGDIRHVT